MTYITSGMLDLLWPGARFQKNAGILDFKKVQ